MSEASTDTPPTVTGPVVGVGAAVATAAGPSAAAGSGLYKRLMEPTRVVMTTNSNRSISLAGGAARYWDTSTPRPWRCGPRPVPRSTANGPLRPRTDHRTDLVGAEKATTYAPDPAHDFVIGGDNVAFTAVCKRPNGTDRRGGRRTGNREDYRTLKLTVSLTPYSHAGHLVEPVDLHPSIRHLEATRDILTLTDKAVNVHFARRQQPATVRDGADRPRSPRTRPMPAPIVYQDQCQSSFASTS